MTRIKQAEICLFVFMITAGGAALASCPNTMPLKLLVDCIAYEGGGLSFPTSDYAHIDHYQDWLKTQPATTIFPPDTAGSPIVK